jgi:exodeoxyribonuclease V beta subunit
LEAWIAPDGGNEYTDNTKRLARISGAVASEIVRILNSSAEIVSEDKTKEVAPSDFAVLVSKHGQAEAICTALRKRGVPAIQAGGEDIMATDEAAEILAILRAVNEPRKSTLRQAALTTRLLGRTSAGLASLNANPAEQDRGLNEFIAWEGHWQTRGLVSLLARIDVDESITERLASNDQGERRITNLRHIVEILSGFAAESGSKPNEVIRWMSQEIQRAKNRADLEERQLRLEGADAEARDRGEDHRQNRAQRRIGDKNGDGFVRLGQGGAPSVNEVLPPTREKQKARCPKTPGLAGMIALSEAYLASS